MTPCEEKGYKVGDEFRVIEARSGFAQGQLVTLYRDDKSDCPVFKGENTHYRHADGDPGAYTGLDNVELVKHARRLITRTNGKPFATEASARQQLTAKGLQGTHEVVPHGGGYALAPINRDDDPITLQPGDYVSTQGMTEEQYHAVARAFENAGCPRFDRSKGRGTGSYLEWWDGVLVSTNSPANGGRHLTIDQVLGAVNAGKRDDEWIQNTTGEQPVEDDVMVICKMRDGSLWRDGMPRPAGRMGWYFDGDNTDIVAYKIHNDAEDAPSQNDEADTGSTMTTTQLDTVTDPITTLKQARQARDEAEKAYQEVLAEAREYLGEGFMLAEVGVDWAAPDEDMNDPANWRKGDVLECVTPWGREFSVGTRYVLREDCCGDYVSVKADDEGDQNGHRAYRFRFHHRPA